MLRGPCLLPSPLPLHVCGSSSLCWRYSHLPSSLASASPDWLQLMFSSSLTCDLPWCHCSELTRLCSLFLCSCLYLLSARVSVLGLLIFFSSDFMSFSWGRALSFLSSVKNSAQDLLEMLVEWKFIPCLTDPKCLKVWYQDSIYLEEWSSDEACGPCLRQSPWVCSVSGMWGMDYLNLCLLLERDHSHRSTEFMSWMQITSSKTYFLHFFPGRKFPRFWEVPYLRGMGGIIFCCEQNHRFRHLYHPTSSLATWSQPTVCLWRCGLYWGLMLTVTLFFPSAVEKVSEAFVSIRRIQGSWHITLLCCVGGFYCPFFFLASFCLV